jgi:predicted CxxxxCH...CXXCH cytochrome family protein
MFRSRAWFPVFALTLGLAACGPEDDEPSDDGGGDVRDQVDDTRDADDVDDAGPARCELCHGGDGHFQPPRAVDGAVDRSARGVGAHAAHLRESAWHTPLRCAYCHVVPLLVEDPGHVDRSRPADVTFSGLAAALVGTAAEWDGATCNVYCHGGALRVAPRRSGTWTGLDGTICNGCHGWPPGGGHPRATDCARCHLDVIGDDGAIARPALHIDSIVGAPHGAHIVHLGGSLPTGPGIDLPCISCHPDGEAYHGPLRDGRTLEETTVCDPCHVPGTRVPSDWRDFPVLGS